MSNFDFTDKAQDSIGAAAQLAKDYANAQIHPAHIAFALLNEGAGEQSVPGGLNSASGTSLFSSVIQKAGGDPVSALYSKIDQYTNPFILDSSKAQPSKAHCPHTPTKPSAR